MTAKKKKKFGAEYLFAALFLVIAAMVIGWQLTRETVVSDVTVTGHRMADPGEIRRVSGVEEGLHGDSIAFLEVIERVETLPWVASAYVSLSQSGHLRIRVEEEEPIALLADGRRSALVTADGIQLPVVLGKAIDVPILHGFRVGNTSTQTPDTLTSEPFRTASEFLQQVRRYPGLYAMISEMMVTESDGVVALSNESTVRLTFGHGDFDERIRKWQAFQAQVVAEKGMGHVRSLDFRYRGQVVALE